MRKPVVGFGILTAWIAKPPVAVTVAISSDTIPPVSQGTSLSAQSTGAEPRQHSFSTLQNAAGSHLPSGEGAPPTALLLLDHQSLHPPEDTLYQVVAQEEVDRSSKVTMLAVQCSLTDSASINAMFDQYSGEKPGARSAGVSTPFIWLRPLLPIQP